MLHKLLAPFRIEKIDASRRHEFHVASFPAPAGGFCAEVRNTGSPLPVAARLRDTRTGRSWPLDQPIPRLGLPPQTWCWTSLPPDVHADSLQVEIWEQNNLFRYF